MSLEHFFRSDYFSARNAFLEASTAVGARLWSSRHPSARGPHGEDLHLDACWLGPPDADTVMLSVCGTHGAEGYPGSAAQGAWLHLHGHEALPAGVAVVMVHATNPFGFAHGLRVNENGVDLNRNAVDFSRPLPTNPLFEALMAEIGELPTDLATAAQRRLDAIEALTRQHGEWVVQDALTRGQYTHPGRYSFGGHETQWTLLTMEALFAHWFGSVRHVAYVDWHSLVELDDHRLVYLCFNRTGDALFQRCGRLWGAEHIDRATVNGQWKIGPRPATARPTRHGMLMWGLQRALAPKADMAGGNIEFCCHPRHGLSMLQDTMLDIEAERLFAATDRSGPEADALRQRLRDSCSPPRVEWRRAAVALSLQVHTCTLRAAGEWAAERVPAEPGELVYFSRFE
jgi:hypothetical protein